MKVKIFKLSSGETVISCVESEDREFYILNNPYALTEGEEQKLLLPFAKNGSGIKFYKNNIVAECEPTSFVEASYAEKFELASA